MGYKSQTEGRSRGLSLADQKVDPQAEFLYVPSEQVMEVAKREDAIPFDAPQSRGLDAIAEGFRLVYQYHELLERQISVYDALYAYCCQTSGRPKLTKLEEIKSWRNLCLISLHTR